MIAVIAALGLVEGPVSLHRLERKLRGCFRLVCYLFSYVALSVEPSFVRRIR